MGYPERYPKRQQLPFPPWTHENCLLPWLPHKIVRVMDGRTDGPTSGCREGWALIDQSVLPGMSGCLHVLQDRAVDGDDLLVAPVGQHVGGVVPHVHGRVAHQPRFVQLNTNSGRSLEAADRLGRQRRDPVATKAKAVGRSGTSSHGRTTSTPYVDILTCLPDIWCHVMSSCHAMSWDINRFSFCNAKLELNWRGNMLRGMWCMV